MKIKARVMTSPKGAIIGCSCWFHNYYEVILNQDQMNQLGLFSSSLWYNVKQEIPILSTKIGKSCYGNG